MEGFSALFGIALVLAGLWWLERRLAAHRMGAGSEQIGGYRMKRELGQEATDMDAVNAALSRNAPFGTVPQELQGLGRGASTYVAPLKDDETYAKRFHAAFGTTEKKE